MGNVISNAANGIGGIIAAPFKPIFGGSCEDDCPGQWDLVCFIEHLCFVNLVKFLMMLGLCYITLMFFYLLFKLGLCQCIVRSLCRMCCAACETYWFALEDMTCFLWHKLRNTKRVHRRRFRDVEKGYTLSSESGSDNDRGLSVGRKRKSRREGRNARWCNSFHPSRRNGSHSCHHHHHHLRLKSSDVSVHFKGGSKRQRKSRRVQLAHVRRNSRRSPKIFKKQRIR